MPELQVRQVRSYAVRPGSRFPAGATALPDGVNFCVFSRDATRMELLLYAAADSPEPFQVITLAPEANRTFFFWHVFVERLPAGTFYTWRADGPSDTRETGRAFNPRKELVDPWARAVSDRLWDRRRAMDRGRRGQALDARGRRPSRSQARARRLRCAGSKAR